MASGRKQVPTIGILIGLLVADMLAYPKRITNVQFLVMNLEHKLRVFLAQIWFWIFGQEYDAILVG
jgi:uncharacterized protein YacL